MDNRKFDRATAEIIFGMANEGVYTIRDDGVFFNELCLDKVCRKLIRRNTAFDWTPAHDWPGSQNPMTAPLLPIPFTANQLAACLLDGTGYGIQKALDRCIGYPLDANDGVLERFDDSEIWARDALRDAYAAAAKAQLQVGEFDYDEECRAEVLVEKWTEAEAEANAREGVFDPSISPDEANQRRGRAVASVADLQLQSMRAEAAVKGKWFAWRKAMVRELLGGDAQQSRITQLTQTAEGDLSNLKNETDRQAEQFAFYNGFLDLEHWSALVGVSAREAAMLLSLHHPTKEQYEDAKTRMRPDMPDGHLERLDRRLTDYGTQNPCQFRRLLDWYLAAQDMKIKLSPEAQEFMGFLAKQDAGSSPVPTHNLKEPAASRAPESATRAPEWSVKKPRRYGGYTAPLHALLGAAHRAGKPPPTAHEVLEAWRVNKPPEIDKVLADGFDYYGGKDGTKTADLAALRAAIKRATSAR